MKGHARIPQVAILVSMSRGWGRRIVKGIFSYAHKAGPWHIWVSTSGPDSFDHLP